MEARVRHGDLPFVITQKMKILPNQNVDLSKVIKPFETQLLTKIWRKLIHHERAALQNDLYRKTIKTYREQSARFPDTLIDAVNRLEWSKSTVSLDPKAVARLGGSIGLYNHQRSSKDY